MQITLTYPTLPHRNSVRASQVMDNFGIGPDSAERVIADQLEIPIHAGDVVLFTGPSGSGKSSLLNAVVQHIETGDLPRRHGGTEESKSSPLLPPEEGPGLRSKSSSCPIIKLSEQVLVSHALVDSLPLPFEEALQLLSMCGLGEAPLLLRTPQELSEGQRYRFLIALAVAQRPRWIVADEFTAVLDRTTAKVIAYNIRRLADRFGIGFLLATAMDDVAADLQPNLRVQCDLDGRVSVSRRSGDGSREKAEGLSPEVKSEIRSSKFEMDDPASVPPAGYEPSVTSHLSANDQRPKTKDSRAGKKKDRRSHFTLSCGLASPPNPTGRISLGGITAVTRSA